MSPSVSSHAANHDCMLAQIDPVGPLERPKPASSVLDRIPKVVIDERVFPLPAERRVHASLHPAEQFAQDVLSSGEPVTAACVERLFNLLPARLDERFGSGSGRSFVAGVFRHGGVVGLTNTCRSFPQSVSLAITWAMQQAGSKISDFTFCSISLNLNVKTEVHRDVNNDDADNLVLAVTNFSGGHIWAQSESGSHMLPVNGSLVPGELYDVAAAPVRFYARKRLHCTMPWTGDRLVLILFSGGDATQLPSLDFEHLKSLGFRPSVSASTACPPLAYVPPPAGALEPLLSKVSAKVKGVPLDNLMFLDVFCGTGGLCASIRQLGMKLSVGLDRHAQRGCKCPVVSLDLTKPGSRAILHDLLKQPNVVACHLSPPVTTSCASLQGPRSGGFRNAAHPEGLPGLQGTDLELVQGANTLFAMCAEVWHFCWSHGVFCSIAHPSRSIMWLSASLRSCQSTPFLSTSLHQCMFGSYRRKATRLLHTVPYLQKLGVTCDGGHDHEPWRSPAQNRLGLPPLLCKTFAQAFVDQLLACGALAPASSLANASLSLSMGARVATATQPSGRRIPPLVPEFARTVKLAGPADQLPCTSKTKLVSPWAVPNASEPALWFHGVWSELELLFGIPWTPSEFVEQACKAKHPRSLDQGVPACIDRLCEHSSVSVARERTAELRKWMLRKKDLDESFDGPAHCKQILAGKPMKLFGEMVEAAGHADVNLVRDIHNGFDLLGEIPSSSVLPKKTTVASLSIEDVRIATPANQRAIWEATRTCRDPEITSEVYRLTLEERDKGWLTGPFTLADVPETAIVTRRFGVRQGVTTTATGVAAKIRPIDDFTESLANLSCTCAETIDPHSVNIIVAGILKRCRSLRKSGRDARLLLRTIDLRKAYKQLPLSERALGDAYICVLNPNTGEPELYQSQVLPFGAKPSVQGFCRASGAIWAVGQALLHIHWSAFFDDYVVVASPEEKGHLDLVLRSYFALIGWETSDEKDAGFKSVAKALGVEFSLDEIHLGLLRVQNTEARKRELVSTIESIVQQGGAHAKELECLRGRLQFAESQVFGRGAAQRMRAISKAMKLSGFVALDDSLAEALLFLKDRVLHGEARMIRACDRPTYHLFTDASYEADVPAGLGGILYSDGGLLLRWYSESVDTDVLEAINKEGKKGLIYELEACAAVQGVVQLCNSLNDCNLICYCDNEAALAALIRCASESPVVASQLNKLSMLEDEKGISVWRRAVVLAASDLEWGVASSAFHLQDVFTCGNVPEIPMQGRLGPRMLASLSSELSLILHLPERIVNTVIFGAYSMNSNTLTHMMNCMDFGMGMVAIFMLLFMMILIPVFEQLFYRRQYASQGRSQVRRRNRTILTTTTSFLSAEDTLGTKADGSQQPPFVDSTFPQLRHCKLLSWNSGGLAANNWDILQNWLADHAVQLCCIQETRWNMEQFWNNGHYHVIHHGQGRSGGLMTLIHNGLAHKGQIRSGTMANGRIQHTRIYDPDGGIDIINIYQRVWSHGAVADVTAQRKTVWNALNACLDGIPARNQVLVCGDFNTQLPHCKGVTGTAVSNTTYRDKRDEHELLDILRLHGLIAANTFHDAKQYTYCGSGSRSQIDYLFMRSNQAQGLSKRAHGLHKFPLLAARGEGYHVPLLAHVPRRWRIWRYDSAPRQPRGPSRPELQRHIKDHVAHVEHYLQQALVSPFDSVEAVDQAIIEVQNQIATQVQHVPVQHQRPWQNLDLRTVLKQAWAHLRQARARRGCGLRDVFQAWRHMQQFSKLIKSTRTPCRRLRRQRLLSILNDAQYQERKRNIHGIYRLVDRLAPKRTQARPQMRDDAGVLLDARQEATKTASYLRCLYVGEPCVDPLMLLAGVGQILTTQDIYDGLQAIPVNKAGPKHLALNSMYKHASAWLAPIYAEFLASWWNGRVPYIPQPFKDAWLVMLTKPGKVCRGPADMRPIGLSHPVGKALLRALREKVQPWATEYMAYTPQWGYLRGREASDAMARAFGHCSAVRALCQSQTQNINHKRAGHQRQELVGGLAVALDIAKAFDSVPHAEINLAMQAAQIPPELRQLVLLWITGAQYHLKGEGGNLTVDVGRGVRQGCVLSPLLYIMVVARLHSQLRSAFGDEADQILDYFADDTLIHQEFTSPQGFREAIERVGKLLEVLAQAGLNINDDKTQVLLRLAGSRAKRMLQEVTETRRDGRQLRVSALWMQRFLPVCKQAKYLGAQLSYEAYEDATLHHRVTAARATYGRLRRILTSRSNLSLTSRVRLWSACVASGLYYALDSSGISNNGLQKVRVLVQKQLRAIARMPTHITHVSNQELLDRLGVCEPGAHILHNMQGQLRRWQANADHDNPIPIKAQATIGRWRQQRVDELSAQLQLEQKVNFFKHLLPVGSQQEQSGANRATTATHAPLQTSKRPRTEEQQGRRPPRKSKHQERNGRPEQGSQERDITKLVEAAAKLTLKLADEHQLLLQDCGFTWFVSTEQGGVLPMMFGISSEWKKLKETNPQRITQPLNVLMLECIVTELQARLRKIGEDTSVKTDAIQAGWCTDQGEWNYKTWDPTQKELVATTREPMPTTAVESLLIEVLADIKEPGILHKFHATHTLHEDMDKAEDNKEVCFTIQVSLRNAGERLHRNLTQLCDNMVLKLLRSRLRQERKRRHGLAKQLVNSLGMGQTAWRTILVQRKAFQVMFGVSPFHGTWNARVLEAVRLQNHDIGACEQMIQLDVPTSGRWQLQAMVDAWHRQAFPYALESAPQWLALRLDRFQQRCESGPVNKVRTAMDWCTDLMLPEFTEGLEVKHVRYRVCAFAVHLGESVTSGHYRALLYNAITGKLHYCDDNARAVLLKDFGRVSRDVYAVFLARSH
ncbi:pol [Symbiodinium sp. CCMP2592]|nr:pol [Symbiodinium sp. CCMP2592]